MNESHHHEAIAPNRLRVQVDQSRCKTDGSCVRIAPELFYFTAFAKKAALRTPEIPLDMVDKCLEATRKCPYNAIIVTQPSRDDAAQDSSGSE
ncbi:MAG: hypothetical protein GF398_19050 [Chitinivibrionales bacterium]|nr:hypothetical protein [Chitinivibrionales bacterium]